LPGSRAKSWRFSQGYLKKTGDSAKVVDRAQATAQTKPGTVGIKVGVLSPDAILKDKIDTDDKMIRKLKENSGEKFEEEIKEDVKVEVKDIKEKEKSE
jgi:ribosomal protein S3